MNSKDVNGNACCVGTHAYLVELRGFRWRIACFGIRIELIGLCNSVLDEVLGPRPKPDLKGRRIWEEEAFFCGADGWILKQAKVGVPVAEVIRKSGISDQTFYRSNAKYAGLEIDQVRQMAQLQEEKLRLKS